MPVREAGMVRLVVIPIEKDPRETQLETNRMNDGTKPNASDGLHQDGKELEAVLPWRE